MARGRRAIRAHRARDRRIAFARREISVRRVWLRRPKLLLALPGLSVVGQLRVVRHRKTALKIRYHFTMSNKAVKNCVFPVAGRGTRFLPVTKASPKEMLPIVDKPLIQYAVDEALSAGAETLVFITGSSKRAIEDHFDSNPELEAVLQAQGKQELLATLRGILPSWATCVYIRQPAPLGLGHAVLCARPVVGDAPFMVHLADDLIDAKVSVPEADDGSVFDPRRQRARRTDGAEAGHGQVRHRDAGARDRRAGRKNLAHRGEAEAGQGGIHLGRGRPVSADRRRYSTIWRRSARARAARSS